MAADMSDSVSTQALLAHALFCSRFVGSRLTGALAERWHPTLCEGGALGEGGPPRRLALCHMQSGAVGK